MRHFLIIIILLFSSLLVSCEKKEGIIYSKMRYFGTFQWSRPGNISWRKLGDEKKDGKYVGEIENGKPNGQGIITFPDGRKYEGHFEKGEMHGQGIFTFPDERKFSGEFRKHKLWNITYYGKDGKIIRKWFNGEKVF